MGNYLHPLLKPSHDAQITVKDITDELKKRKLAVIMPDHTELNKLWLLHSLFEKNGNFYAFRDTNGYTQEGLVSIDPKDLTKSMKAMGTLDMFSDKGKRTRGTWSLTGANLAYCKDVQKFLDETEFQSIPKTEAYRHRIPTPAYIINS